MKVFQPQSVNSAKRSSQANNTHPIINGDPIKRTCMLGHVTGSFVGGRRENSRGGGIHNSLSLSID